MIIPREEVILNQTFKNEGKRECWGQGGMGGAHSNSMLDIWELLNKQYFPCLE